MNSAQYSTDQTSAVETYKLFRARIEHEDNLIVQRLSWLVASQAFLFTAYAITTNGLTGLDSKAAGRYLEQATLLFRLIPTVAICVALLIDISILAALRAIRQIRRLYQAKSISPDLPPIQTAATTRLLGLSAPLLLPVLFVSVWLVLLLNGPGRR
ncbi:MAG TPA: hypothetical protein VL793_02130 [Patescibacteria group bacterium]|jgi:hypothetical protein|nr:hypothetical protein [Patescibacteria group bacterium]